MHIGHRARVLVLAWIVNILVTLSLSLSLSLQPTDSLNRPTELIPPGSPVRFQELCNGKKYTADESPGEQEPSFGNPPGPVAESAAKDSCVNGTEN